MLVTMVKFVIMLILGNSSDYHKLQYVWNDYYMGNYSKCLTTLMHAEYISGTVLLHFSTGLNGERLFQIHSFGYRISCSYLKMVKNS